MSSTSGRTKTLALSLLVFLAATADAGAETSVAACDRLAAHPSDPAKPATIAGVATGSIKTDEAIAACAHAIDAEPANPRLHFELGRAYFDKADYSSAFREYSTATDSGYAAAIGALGYLYDSGLGTAPDDVRAVSLYRRAADADVGFAAHNLAVMLREGTGTATDYTESLKYFRKAVSLGYRQSLVDVGFAYDNGYGVRQAYSEAMRWYRQAAEDDIPEALNNIGSLYEGGDGVAQNFGEAIAWYRKAQAQDYALAFVNMANLIDRGKGIEANPATAGDYVMQALDKGSAAEDAFNIKYIFDEARWTPEFWKAVQTRLAASGAYKGAIDGAASAETRRAMETMIDK